MDKILIYAMEGKEMCFMHALLNAIDLHEAGKEVKIVIEGQAVKLPKELDGKNDVYEKAKELGLIAGVCKACSAAMEVLEDNEKLGLTILDDMKGHAGMKPFIEEGFEVVVF